MSARLRVSSLAQPLDSLLRAPQSTSHYQNVGMLGESSMAHDRIAHIFSRHLGPSFCLHGLYLRSLECKSKFTSSSTHANVVTTVIQPPHSPHPSGCLILGNKPILVACWTGMMVYDAGSTTRLSYENCHLKPTGILRPLITYGYSRFPHT